MVSAEQVEAFMKQYFPNCPMCGSDSGYEAVHEAWGVKTKAKCKGCQIEWLSNNDKFIGKELKWLQIWKPDNHPLRLKRHPTTFWKELRDKQPDLISAPLEAKTEESMELRSLNVSEEALRSGIEKSLKDLERQEAATWSILNILMAESHTEAIMLKLLKAIIDQNKVLIRQNELLYRALQKLGPRQDMSGSQ